MLDYALDDRGLKRVTLHCAEQNYKSRAIPLRLKFTQESIMRNIEWLYDNYVSHAIYGMPREEWRTKRGSR
jgi:ribosomal-protein-serine acetyltransferase